MIEKQNDLKEVIVHLRTPSGAPAGPKDLSGKPGWYSVRVFTSRTLLWQTSVNKWSCDVDCIYILHTYVYVVYMYIYCGAD